MSFHVWDLHSQERINQPIRYLAPQSQPYNARIGNLAQHPFNPCQHMQILHSAQSNPNNNLILMTIQTPFTVNTAPDPRSKINQRSLIDSILERSEVNYLVEGEEDVYCVVCAQHFKMSQQQKHLEIHRKVTIVQSQNQKLSSSRQKQNMSHSKHQNKKLDNKSTASYSAHPQIQDKSQLHEQSKKFILKPIVEPQTYFVQNSERPNIQFLVQKYVIEPQLLQRNGQKVMKNPGVNQSVDAIPYFDEQLQYDMNMTERERHFKEYQIIQNESYQSPLSSPSKQNHPILQNQQSENEHTAYINISELGKSQYDAISDRDQKDNRMIRQFKTNQIKTSEKKNNKSNSSLNNSQANNVKNVQIFDESRVQICPSEVSLRQSLKSVKYNYRRSNQIKPQLKSIERVESQLNFTTPNKQVNAEQRQSQLKQQQSQLKPQQQIGSNIKSASKPQHFKTQSQICFQQKKQKKLKFQDKYGSDSDEQCQIANYEIHQTKQISTHKADKTSYQVPSQSSKQNNGLSEGERNSQIQEGIKHNCEFFSNESMKKKKLPKNPLAI